MTRRGRASSHGWSRKNSWRSWSSGCTMAVGRYRLRGTRLVGRGGVCWIGYGRVSTSAGGMRATACTHGAGCLAPANSAPCTCDMAASWTRAARNWRPRTMLGCFSPSASFWPGFLARVARCGVDVWWWGWLRRLKAGGEGPRLGPVADREFVWRWRRYGGTIGVLLPSHGTRSPALAASFEAAVVDSQIRSDSMAVWSSGARLCHWQGPKNFQLGPPPAVRWGVPTVPPAGRSSKLL
jgi:hypothetical protein